jgi:hypothetical protein
MRSQVRTRFIADTGLVTALLLSLSARPRRED